MAERGGQSGNTNATKDKRLITDELRRVCKQSPEKLKKACEKVLNNAVNGDLAAFTVMADRLDGKPHQSQTLDGDLGISVIEYIKDFDDIQNTP